jgi:hypothetical protein
MKTTTHTVRDEGMGRVAAQLEESIFSLFCGFPSLCGFAVQDRAGLPDGSSEILQGGLFLTDIGLFPAPGIEEARMICEEIRETLVQLIDERPEVRELLSGRTFARSLH